MLSNAFTKFDYYIPMHVPRNSRIEMPWENKFTSLPYSSIKYTVSYSLLYGKPKIFWVECSYFWTRLYDTCRVNKLMNLFISVFMLCTPQRGEENKILQLWNWKDIEINTIILWSYRVWQLIIFMYGKKCM